LAATPPPITIERAPTAVEKLGAWTLIRTYPLSPEQLSVAHIWEPQDSERYTVAAKGAPEAIVELCALDRSQRAVIHERVARMASDGLRVLAVARGTLSRTPENAIPGPSSQRDLRLHFIGLTGLADPIRVAVPAALRECYAAGIRIVMITGDYPGTATAIARQIGLARPETVVTGPELAAMSDTQLRERVGRVNVFARVMPEQKLRLVQALKANGEIVAMTGDGVNDAPALKAAHIGVAMGKRGSDVAREAASLVLLDDDFTSMVEAVKLGRRIFDNVQKAMCYIVAVHVPTAGMALLPLLFGWPLMFYPVHIVFLEFVIDPACSIAFEAEPAEQAREQPVHEIKQQTGDPDGERREQHAIRDGLADEHLVGGWRTVYVTGSLVLLYFNVFILVVQLFKRIPGLIAAAPKNSIMSSIWATSKREPSPIRSAGVSCASISST